MDGTKTQDIIDLLLEDHDEFRTLFDELDRTEGEFRGELFRYVVARLASHEAAEEAVVHRALRDEVPNGEPIAESVLSEEEAAEQLLAQMDDMEPASPEFSEALGRLKQEVLSHAQHEEAEEFPRLREHLDAGRREQLGNRFQSLRDAGPTRPHPNTPQDPNVRAAAGPIVGMFDRARDAARDAFKD